MFHDRTCKIVDVDPLVGKGDDGRMTRNEQADLRSAGERWEILKGCDHEEVIGTEISGYGTRLGKSIRVRGAGYSGVCVYPPLVSGHLGGGVWEDRDAQRTDGLARICTLSYWRV